MFPLETLNLLGYSEYISNKFDAYDELMIECAKFKANSINL